MINPDEAMTYLAFVAERHKVWERRRIGGVGPWTDDPILRSHKFTNVYRVLDYGSQFLLRELLTPDLSPRDTLARCFLYRYTNLPATWTDLRDGLGDYPKEADLKNGVIQRVTLRRDAGHKVFSGAYVILPQPNRTGDKVVQAVELAARFMDQYADEFIAATTQQECFRVLRQLYGVGPFLAMQILTDWGYSDWGWDAENEFVIPGPGCIKGAKHIDPDADPLATVMWAVNAVHAMPDVPLLGQRPPSWMDIQNTLCEYSKYHRFEPKDRQWVPAHPGPQPEPVLPAHWLDVQLAPDTVPTALD